jgi:hypothetical protein
MAGKKTFVAGEVLLAQDVNDFLMDQSVMNFASSAARSSAIPTPTEGMTTYVQDRNQIETFDGAEYRGMSSLQLIKKEIVGTAVNSVVVTSVFSAAYENYRIVYNGGLTSAATGGGFTFKLNNSTGSPYQNAGYFTSLAGTITGTGTSSATTATCGLTGTATMNITLEIGLPFLTSQTSISNMSYSGGGGTGFAHTLKGSETSSTSHTGFTFAPATGTMTGGTIYVYGYGT